MLEEVLRYNTENTRDIRRIDRTTGLKFEWETSDLEVMLSAARTIKAPEGKTHKMREGMELVFDVCRRRLSPDGITVNWIAHAMGN
jgi:hypothetical protein